MELLDQPSNGSSGATIMSRMHSKTRRYLDEMRKKGTVPTKGTWLKNHDLVFDNVKVVDAGKPESNSTWWSRKEIEFAAPLKVVKGMPAENLKGSPSKFILASGPGGVKFGHFRHSKKDMEFKVKGARNQGRVAGLELKTFKLTNSGSDAQKGTKLGQVVAKWRTPKGKGGGAPDWTMPEDEISIDLLSTGQPYSGYLGDLPGMDAEKSDLSPVRFANVKVGMNGVEADGELNSTIPMLNKVPLSVKMLGNDITFAIDYAPDQLRSPIPGMRFFDTNISLWYSTQRGLGVSGFTLFSVKGMGEGMLNASYSKKAGIEFDGSFDFDTDFFDQAGIKIWYKNKKLGAEGTVAVTKPGKIRGVKSASLTVGVKAIIGNYKETQSQTCPASRRPELLRRKTTRALVSPVILNLNRILQLNLVQ